MRSGSTYRRSPRGFALLIVMFAISVLTVVVVGMQGSAMRQASDGREALARVRAKWAARAGLEAMIARLAYNVQNPDEVSAYTVHDDMKSLSTGALDGSSWEIVHEDLRSERDGPADPHAKVNINLMTFDDLMLLPGMTEDAADAILDWIDADDDVTGLGAESGYYSTLPSPYEPRNAPLRSLMELDLVAGVDPLDVRGEDWNLNGRLDPNENDGDASWPPDNADGVLDAGWSAIVTTASVDWGLSASGQERLNLRMATAEDLVGRFPWMTPTQADVLLGFAGGSDARLQTILSTTLRTLAQQQGLPAAAVQNLDLDQLAEVWGEVTLFSREDGPRPGRLNVNTVRRETLDYLAVFSDTVGAGLADSIIFTRDSRGLGFTSIVELLEVPLISGNRSRLAELAEYLDVSSNAYVVTSRGRDDRTGIEVEIVATIERTALPIVISEILYR